jgi:hypothetical protein
MCVITGRLPTKLLSHPPRQQPTTGCCTSTSSSAAAAADVRPRVRSKVHLGRVTWRTRKTRVSRNQGRGIGSLIDIRYISRGQDTRNMPSKHFELDFLLSLIGICLKIRLPGNSIVRGRKELNILSKGVKRPLP